MPKLTIPLEIRQQFVEAGRRGGQKTKERHGTNHFSEIRKQRKSYPQAKEKLSNP
jgi:hypothetical protein